MSAHGAPTAGQASRPRVQRAGFCAEGDRCPRYHCLECGEYWLGNDEHVCGAGPGVRFTGPSSSREQLEQRIATWMDQELQRSEELTACAQRVLQRARDAALGEALLDTYGHRLILDMWREHMGRREPAPMPPSRGTPKHERVSGPSLENVAPHDSGADGGPTPLRWPRRVDLDQLATDEALLESLMYVDGQWLRLGDLDKRQCRALQIRYEKAARGFGQLADSLEDDQVVRDRWTAQQLADVLGDTLTGTAPARPSLS